MKLYTFRYYCFYECFFTLARSTGDGTGWCCSCWVGGARDNESFGFDNWVLWLGLGLLFVTPLSAWVRRPARLANEAGPGAGLWPDNIKEEAPKVWPAWKKKTVLEFKRKVESDSTKNLSENQRPDKQFLLIQALISQLVVHRLGTTEVVGSNPRKVFTKSEFECWLKRRPFW